MKTKRLLKTFVVSFAVIISCFFNNAYGQWWNINGNNSADSNWIGTIDSARLVFKTHNIERARFLATGNFGIGTTTPQSMLDVNGTIRGGYNTSTTSYFGVAAVGYCGQSGGSFASIANNTSTSFALLQTSTNTYLNCVSNNTIVFRNGNSNEGGWTTTGLGIGTTTPAYQLELSTNSAGKPTSSTWTISSDRRTKTNIQDYKHGLDLIRKIHLVSFEYNGKAHTPKGEHGIGVIAQELQPLFPNSVRPFTVKADSTNPGGDFLGVDFHEVFVTNIAAVQELDSMNTLLAAKNTVLQNQVSTLQNQVSELTQQMAALQSSMNSVLGVNNIQAGSTGNVIVYPNPTDKEVNVQINQSLQNGEIDVLDMEGRMITQQLNVKGNSKMNLDLSSFAKGIYILKVKDGSSEIYSQKVILQ